MVTAPLLGAFNLQLQGVQTQIAGTTTDIPEGGTQSNFGVGVQVGNFAVFDIFAVDDSNNATDFADLRVTYAADNGGVGSNIMIAQTTNSQGLTDSGTLSVLIGLSSTTGGTVTLNFDWFMPGSFDGGVEQPGAAVISPTKFRITTFDIDFQQLVAVNRPVVENYLLNGVTLLTATDANNLITFTDDGADSFFNDPETAAQFLTVPSTSQTLVMGKQFEGGNALFMFEFRDPSDVTVFTDPTITPVPEPSASGILTLLAGLAGFTVARRRP